MDAEKMDTNQDTGIKITQKQASVFSGLLRLTFKTKMETVTNLSLEDTDFCKELLRINFPKRRPTEVTESLILQCVKDLDVEKTKHLFVGYKVRHSFSHAELVDFQKDIFWLYCYRRGLIAAGVAEVVEYRDTYEAFLAGFFADLGTLLFGMAFPTQGEAIFLLQTRPNSLRNCMETVLFGESSVQKLVRSGISQLITPRVLQAIENHYSPYPSRDKQGKLTNILHLASAINDVGQAQPTSYILQMIQAGLTLFDAEFDVEEIYNVANAKSHDYCRQLRIDLPPIKPYQSLIVENSATIEDLSVLSFDDERKIDDKSTFHHRVKSALKERFDDENFSVIMIHVDDFPKIVKSYGVPTGDLLLEQLAKAMTKSMRHADFIGQINRETYAILLPDTTNLGGKIVSERIRGLTKTGNIMAGAIRVNTSVSIGGITVSSDRPYYEAEEEEDDADDFSFSGFFSNATASHEEKKDDPALKEAISNVWKDLEHTIIQAKKEGGNRVLWLKK
jgi:diguanylate cyclase (GGDEF)-like protein